MHPSNKNEDESDYLQSLFSKPFCQRFYLDNNTQTPCPKQQQPHKHRLYYHNVIAETNEVVIRKSHIDNKDRNGQETWKNKQKMTPYQSRKRQDRMFAQQIKRSMDQKQREIAKKLETTQKQWFIIKANQKGACKQGHNNGLSNLQLAHISLDEQAKKPSANKLNKCEPFSEGRRREEAKNIKSMMSYYKNKRAIKQMAKFRDTNNLTNFLLEESINMRIEIASNSKIDTSEDSDPFKNLGLSRKAYKREKHNMTQTCTSEKARVKFVKFQNLKDVAPHSIFLKGILSSKKIGITSLKRRSKTKMRPHRQSQKEIDSNQIENRFKHKNFDLTGWENTFLQDSGQI